MKPITLIAGSIVSSLASVILSLAFLAETINHGTFNLTAFFGAAILLVIAFLLLHLARQSRTW